MCVGVRVSGCWRGWVWVRHLVHPGLLALLQAALQVQVAEREGLQLVCFVSLCFVCDSARLLLRSMELKLGVNVRLGIMGWMMI